PAGTLDTLSNGLAVDGGKGTNLLYVTETGRTTPDAVSLEANTIYSKMVPFNVAYSATGGTFGAGLFLATGTADDPVFVRAAPAGPLTYVFPGSGNDTGIVSSLAGTLDTLDSLLVLDVGSGSNTLYISEAGRTAPDTITMGTGFLDSAVVPFTIYYRAT